MKKIGYDNFLQFDAASHTYSDIYGNTDYVSVSGVLKTLSIPFDEKAMSYAVAKSRITKGSSAIAIRNEQDNVLREWHAKRDNSCVYGTNIHEKLEYYFKTGFIDAELKALAESVAKFIGNTGNMMQEVRLYSEAHRIAGTTDICVQRTARGNIWDVYDYKTNIERGIEFYSQKKDGTSLNKFMLEPVNHIEDCNYNKYSLQMSMYAYMMELTYGVQIGRLAILFIDKQMKLHIYPCNYLRNEVMSIFAIRKSELESKNPTYVDAVEVLDNEENNW
jgi:hypothetical protein